MALSVHGIRKHGVSVFGGSSITSGNGTISITGTGGANSGTFSYGISIDGATVTSTGNGQVTLTGTGGGGGATFSSGVLLINGGFVRNTSGAMTVTGTSATNGASNHGVQIFNSVGFEGLGSGAISIAGQTASATIADIIFGSGSIYLGEGPTAGTYTGNLTLTADTVVIQNAAIQSTGALVIQPRTASTSIGLGTGSAGMLNLDAAALGSLQNGFSTITIGRADGTGAVEVRATTWQDDLRLLGASSDVAFKRRHECGGKPVDGQHQRNRHANSSISATGLELLGAGGTYTLTNASNSVGTIAGSTGTVAFTNSTALTVGNVGTSGLSTTGAVTLQTAGATSDITLAQPSVQQLAVVMPWSLQPAAIL